MSQIAFFTEDPLPVFAHLSDDSKRRLEAYWEDGNTTFRQKRLREFFKTLDWLAWGDPQQERVLQKLPPPLCRQLQREIQDYQNHKAEHRVESAEKRAQYRLKIYEYFRIKMPSTDKALLESLRDYELNLTGRDVNWRHYFTLDSFKRIDAFIRASAEERQAWFAQFRQDVDTYKKNYDKLHYARFGQPSHSEFTFDDWCELMGDEAPSPAGHRSRAENSSNTGQRSASADKGVLQACRILEVTLGASPETVKKQFRKLTLSYHPDLPGGNEEKMKTLVGAYEELKRYWGTQSQVL
jgi:hypothetical protein